LARLVQKSRKKTIESDGGNIVNSHVVGFDALQLEVKNYRDGAHSLETFLQSDTFSGANAYKTSDGQFIDATRYSRIESAPPILILQLKRFVYDVRNRLRNEGNDRDGFPNELDIKATKCDSQTANLSYTLQGIVAHSGVAQGGRYSSFIRLHGHKWALINDIEVSECQRDQITALAGGADKGHEPRLNAYLLFSRQNAATFRAGETVLSLDEGIDMKQYLRPELRDSIETDNSPFRQLQSAFSSILLDFMLAILPRSFLREGGCHKGRPYQSNRLLCVR
jgi:hypothetical protein